MVTPGSSDIDPCSSSEKDISETSTLTGTQDVASLSLSYEPVPVPSKIRGIPTIYLRVLRSGIPKGVPKESVAIEGQYFIDLSIPPVPQSVPGVVRVPENLSINTTGAIIADVWVTGNNKLRRVSMKLISGDGDVRTEVHGAFSIGERELRPSFDIELRAKNVTLSLPRFFRGIVTINSPYHRIVLSPAFVERAALLSDVPDVRVYFVGVRPRSWMLWSDDDNGKVGEETAVAGRCPEEPLDKVVVTSSGLGSGVRIRWEGEPELPE